MFKRTTVQQTKHINVVGIRKDSRSCPSNTWQIDSNKDGLNNSPICSNIDLEKCKKYNTDSLSRWANPIILDNGSTVSLDGVIECEFKNQIVDEETGMSAFNFRRKCFFDNPKNCPLDIYNANPDKRDEKMKRCSGLTYFKSLPPKSLTKDQKNCILYAEKYPKDLYTAIAHHYCVPSVFANDCMCADPINAFNKIDKVTWPSHELFWTGLHVENPILYNHRGSWLKACTSENYLNSPFITTKVSDLLKTCKTLDSFLNDERKNDHLGDTQLRNFQDLSVCYIDGKFTGGGSKPIHHGSSPFLPTHRHILYILLFVAVFFVFIMFMAYISSGKKKTSKKNVK